jgi:hypothetical protein
MMKLKAWHIALAGIFILSACAGKEIGKIHILNAKTSVSVDDKYMPVTATNIFPLKTSKVFLWFSWSSAQKDTKVIARWLYLTDDIPVLDYTFTIPRKEGMGSVSLSMPEGKALPAGIYRVTLDVDNSVLKSLTFKVLDK